MVKLTVDSETNKTQLTLSYWDVESHQNLYRRFKGDRLTVVKVDVDNEISY